MKKLNAGGLIVLARFRSWILFNDLRGAYHPFLDIDHQNYLKVILCCDRLTQYSCSIKAIEKLGDILKLADDDLKLKREEVEFGFCF